MTSLGSGTAKLMTGKVLSMAIGFGTAPLIALLFTPEVYGIAGLIETTIAWAAAFSCLGYAQAIPLASSKSEVRGLIRLCLLITAVLLIVVLALPTIAADAIVNRFDVPAARPFLWFVPVLFLLACLLQISQFSLARLGHYGWLSVMHTSAAGTVKSLQIGFGWIFGGTAFFLLLGIVIGTAASIGIAAVLLISVLLSKDGDPTPSLKDLARQHDQFPKVHMWSNVLNVSSLSLPILLMGLLFGTGVVGHYTIGRKFIAMPLMILGSSIASVFYPQAAGEWRESGRIVESINRMMRILAITCIFPIVAVGLLGPMMFETLLTSQWREAGVYSQILAPWILVVLVSAPVSTVFLITRQAGLLLLYNVLLLTLRPLALLAGLGFSYLMSFFSSFVFAELAGETGLGWAGRAIQAAAHFGGEYLPGARLAILMYATVGLAINCHQLLKALQLGQASRKHAAGLLLREVGMSVALLLPATLAYWYMQNTVASFALLFCGSAAYVMILMRRDTGVRLMACAILSRAWGMIHTPAERHGDAT